MSDNEDQRLAKNLDDFLQHAQEHGLQTEEQLAAGVRNAASSMQDSDYNAVEQPCAGCGKPVLLENAWMEDGCPCNTPAGVNNHNLYRWNLLHQLQQKDSREVERLRKEVAKARQESLEEAAKMCETFHKFVADDCARAIRALQSGQDGKGG